MQVSPDGAGNFFSERPDSLNLLKAHDHLFDNPVHQRDKCRVNILAVKRVRPEPSEVERPNQRNLRQTIGENRFSRVCGLTTDRPDKSEKYR